MVWLISGQLVRCSDRVGAAPRNLHMPPGALAERAGENSASHSNMGGFQSFREESAAASQVEAMRADSPRRRALALLGVTCLQRRAVTRRCALPNVPTC